MKQHSLKETSSEIPEVIRRSKEDYYAVLSQMAEDESTVFKNDAHKHILRKIARGISATQIVKELISLKMPRNRDSIRFIVRRYEMEWGIRTYTPRQLNKK